MWTAGIKRGSERLRNGRQKRESCTPTDSELCCPQTRANIRGDAMFERLKSEDYHGTRVNVGTRQRGPPAPQELALLLQLLSFDESLTRMQQETVHVYCHLSWLERSNGAAKTKLKASCSAKQIASGDGSEDAGSAYHRISITGETDSTAGQEPVPVCIRYDRRVGERVEFCVTTRRDEDGDYSGALIGQAAAVRMDPALLRERELFKKRALSTPAVEKRQAASESHKKKKPKLDKESSSGSKHTTGEAGCDRISWKIACILGQCDKG
ncbi:unnamed protein product [Menidia menidia]|uniref:(Atlantic silverside) hypothetical protein n=1 Tax=Menidia menidia TaxID=238744 RepID=A0A8S4BG48_9TELE|nr:unnamed protein product [Menidia menidia]